MQAKGLMSTMGIVIAVAMLGTSPSVAGQKFGAKLSANTFPSNAAEGESCDFDDAAPNPKCTWVQNLAFDRGPNAHKAPKDGVIGKLRLISCVPGSFKLQMVRINGEGHGKALREGPIIEYQGDADDCENQTQTIESFNVNVKVKKGEQLAIKTKKTGMLRCDSGGTKIHIFEPPLISGQGYEEPSDDSGCFLLLEAEYKD